MPEIIYIESSFKTTDEQHLLYDPTTLHQHSAKMNVLLARELIEKFTKEGDRILDPMVGLGTIVIEGMLKYRTCCGIEIEPKYVKLARKNINSVARNQCLSYLEEKQWIKPIIYEGDARKIDTILCNEPSFNAIITSPPFGDQKHGSDEMSESDIRKATKRTSKTNRGGTLGFGRTMFIGYNDQNSQNIGNFTIGNIDQFLLDVQNGTNSTENTYWKAMYEILKGCLTFLKPNGIIALHLKNPVREGTQIMLDQDFIKLCNTIGLLHTHTIYNKLQNISYWTHMQERKFKQKWPKLPSPYPKYEYVLIFQKL